MMVSNTAMIKRRAKMETELDRLMDLFAPTKQTEGRSKNTVDDFTVRQIKEKDPGPTKRDGCAGRKFPSVRQLGDMMLSHPRASSSRDANYPIRGER